MRIDLEPSHPKPISSPLTVKEVISDLSLKEMKPLNKETKEFNMWIRCKPGQTFADISSRSFAHWHKLSPDKPFSTIMANGATKYHWKIPACISIAMAKRAQTFPDNFKLKGTFQENWKQIGNAVPPNLMKHIANHVKKLLGGAE